MPERIGDSPFTATTSQADVNLPWRVTRRVLLRLIGRPLMTAVARRRCTATVPPFEVSWDGRPLTMRGRRKHPAVDRCNLAIATARFSGSASPLSFRTQRCAPTDRPRRQPRGGDIERERGEGLSARDARPAAIVPSGHRSMRVRRSKPRRPSREALMRERQSPGPRRSQQRRPRRSC